MKRARARGTQAGRGLYSRLHSSKRRAGRTRQSRACLCIIYPCMLVDTPRAPRHDPFAALRFRDFRFMVLGSFLAVVAEQMLGVAVGWELYERTRDPLSLGLVGLVQIVPVLLLALPAGHVADRRERKWIVVIALSGIALCALGLVGLSVAEGPLPLFYALLFGIGVSRAFQSPAFSSLSAQV